MAWLLKIETDSILIKEKRKHLSKTLDRVSKLMEHNRLRFGSRESSHRSIYRYTKFIHYRITFIRHCYKHTNNDLVKMPSSNSAWMTERLEHCLI